MRNTSSHSLTERSDFSENSFNVDPEIRALGLRRVRQIEKLLGVRIMQVPSGVFDQETPAEICYHEQASQLLRAFHLISDAKSRADVLAMVIAAAQHEGEPD